MSSKDFSHLGPTLRRVRSSERPTDDGGKKVWHQGDKGVEVVSFVDAQGRVLRQEVHVGNDVAIWIAGKAVMTGTVPAEARTQSVSRSQLIVADAEVTPDSVFSALSLVRGYSGDDKYLGHIRGVLQAAADGLAAAREESVVTGMQPRPKAGEDIPREVTAHPRRSGQNLGFFLAVGAVVLGFVCGALYLIYLKR